MNKRKVNGRTKAEAGNVFAQLGLANPDERLRKARLMNVINDIIKRNEYSQQEAAEKTGLDQSDISRIASGRASRYSTDKLLNILNALGADVELVQRHDANGNLVIEVHELV